MTEQTPDPAAGASRWEAPAAGSSRPATDLATASENLLGGGARQLDSAGLRNALLDLHDFEHNTRDGVHIASLAGAWIALVAGFGGMRDHGGALSFTPRLPGALTRLTFRLSFRGQRLRVQVRHAEATYSLLDGPPRSAEVSRPEEPILDECGSRAR